MGFESPGYLWAMSAAFIPLLIHLIARRRAKVHDFAAIHFILLSNKRIARRLRLKQWLLMALRMLLIAVIPLAFAKPFVTHASEVLVATAEPTSVVIIVDPSFSMGYRIGEETLLERAKSKALEIVSDLRNESDAAVVLASTPARALTPRLTYDRGLLRAAIDSISSTHSRADMQSALRLAEQILVASGQPRREVVLLTDLQATEWEGMARPWSLEHSPQFTLVDVGSDVERVNGAITSVVAEPESGGSGRSVRVTVDVHNDRPNPFEGVLTVRVGSKAAKGVIKIAPRLDVTKEFSILLGDGGINHGVVELTPDALAGDNVQPFVIDFLRRVHVLVVNGAPRTVLHKDETFFLRAALRPARDSASRMSPTYIKPDELTAGQLDYVDVVVLANVASLDQPQVEALLKWVNKGGGLFITAGENVTPKAYNSVMLPLLPLPLRDIRTADEGLFLTGVQADHPIMRLFSRLPDASLFTAATRRYALLDTAPTADTQVLASFTDGGAALVERRIGYGRVVMLTTSIDRDWTELPFKTSYLPLMQQTLLHLSGRLDRSQARSLVVGESRAIEVGRDVTEIRVLRPNGEEMRFSGADLADPELRFHATDLAGSYVVTQLRKEGSERERFTVHVDRRESVLTAVDRSEVEAVVTQGASRRSETNTVAAAPPRERGDIWPMMLVALFVLLTFETWLAYQRA
ncbi:MAG: hypothetical protein ACI9OJ_002393 [Myxococcota bacterium]|jgi:hypothetical protein